MKSAYYIISGIILLAALLILAGRKINPFGSDNSLIAVPGDKEIESIVIISGDNKLTLEKLGENDWNVNGKDKARPAAIDFITSILHRIELKSPVSEDIFNEKVKGNSRPVTKVEVFGHRRKLSSFLVFRPADSSYSAIIRKTPGSIPFIAYIPGSDVDPCSPFITDSKFWIPYNIFNISPGSIERIDLSRGNDTVPLITLISDTENFKALINGAPVSHIDTLALRRYIAYYAFVPFENWSFNMPGEMKERLLKRDTWYTIRVQERSGVISEVKLWKKYLDEPSCTIEDTDRLWGSLNNGRDFFIVTYYDIDPLIKSPDYFISE